MLGGVDYTSGGSISQNLEPTISFNIILSESALDPIEVLLVRHSVGKHVKNYDAWRTNEPFITNYSPEGESFERYQQTQRSGRFSPLTHKPIKYRASFIAARTGGTMFIGVYKRIGDTYPAPKPGYKDIIIVPLALDQKLADLRGKLFIEWGQERAWVQFARNNNKPIVELKRVVEDPPFPHWSKFVTKLSALESLPGDWQKALKILRGIICFPIQRQAKHVM